MLKCPLGGIGRRPRRWKVWDNIHIGQLKLTVQIRNPGKLKSCVHMDVPVRVRQRAPNLIKDYKLMAASFTAMFVIIYFLWLVGKMLEARWAVPSNDTANLENDEIEKSPVGCLG